jgi:MGT family glycosyltransferase
MAALRSQFGLAPDAELASFDRWLRLVLAPAWWGRGVDHLPDTAHFIRPEPPPSDPAPDWLVELRDSRSVYATLGTVFNRTEGVLATVLDGLASIEDLHVIATVGHDVDPADFRHLPSGVRIERFVPQRAVFDVVDAVVAHGGYGTLMGALAAGLPIVTLPLAAGDNMANAMSVVNCGAGVMIAADERRPDVVAERTRQVLDDPGYTQRAQAAATDIAALPGPEHAVELLERLAVQRTPIAR